MEFTKTCIEFDTENTKGKGVVINLKPVKGVHTPEDVQIARDELNNQQEVARNIKVKWQESDLERVIAVHEAAASKIKELRLLSEKWFLNS